jgi:dephospho-CoA kinase
MWDKKKRDIKRAKLRDLVFSDPAARQKLEGIIHPFVRQAQRRFIFQQRKMGRDFCALDIPLLFETGADQFVNYTVLVTAPFYIQAQRVLSRPGMTEKLFYQILEAQMPDLQKRRLADFIIQTGLGKAYSLRALQNILTELNTKQKR